MLRQGTMEFDTPEFTLTLVPSSQTVAGSEPWLKTAVVLTRAKWRAPRSARVSTLEKNLTPPTLLETGVTPVCFQIAVRANWSDDAAQAWQGETKKGARELPALRHRIRLQSSYFLTTLDAPSAAAVSSITGFTSSSSIPPVVWSARFRSLGGRRPPEKA
jgi:hypothetical protein